MSATGVRLVLEVFDGTLYKKIGCVWRVTHVLCVITLQFHTPRNLLLALTGEMGELCECFQWKGDDMAMEGNARDCQRNRVGCIL